MIIIQNNEKVSPLHKFSCDLSNQSFFLAQTLSYLTYWTAKGILLLFLSRRRAARGLDTCVTTKQTSFSRKLKHTHLVTTLEIRTWWVASQADIPEL